MHILHQRREVVPQLDQGSRALDPFVRNFRSGRTPGESVLGEEDGPRLAVEHPADREDVAVHLGGEVPTADSLADHLHAFGAKDDVAEDLGAALGGEGGEGEGRYGVEGWWPYCGMVVI